MTVGAERFAGRGRGGGAGRKGKGMGSKGWEGVGWFSW